MVARWVRRWSRLELVAAAPRVTASGLLDALPGHAAVLDATGEILAVNRTWSTYAAVNGGSAAATGPGANYVGVCERAAGPGSVEALRVAAAFRSIVRGESSTFTLTYPCPGPGRDQWFTVHLQAFHDRSRMVLVVHEDVTDRRSTEVRLERRASQDALTGLGNRLVLTRGLATALAHPAAADGDSGVGVVCIDLDDFKPVNDTHGHAVGDAVLQGVAGRLQELSRPGDIVARLGGDEFAVCVPGMTADGLVGLTRRITGALQLPHLLHDIELTVSASVGSHLATLGDDPATALRRADDAMYRVKHRRQQPPPALRTGLDDPPPAGRAGAGELQVAVASLGPHLVPLPVDDEAPADRDDVHRYRLR